MISRSFRANEVSRGIATVRLASPLSNRRSIRRLRPAASARNDKRLRRAVCIVAMLGAACTTASGRETNEIRLWAMGREGEVVAQLIPAFEREHPGVLMGAPLTDVRITLMGGRAHLKHTEGGDFRQATYRAIRQGLMQAREAGACVLLEPWYRFRLSIPAEKVGRALADVQRMGAMCAPPEMEGDTARLAGTAPASTIT